MSKVITSPVKRWPGTVTLSDPLTYDQVTAYEKSITAAAKIDRDEAVEAELYAAWLPGICACVEAWGLEGLGELSPASFPATPRKASQELIAWLIGELSRLNEGEDDPNG